MARLGDFFALIRNGANIKQGLDDSGYPITRIETISNRTVDRNKMGYAGINDLSKYRDYILQDGDILMSHINSEKHLAKTALYQKNDDEEIIHGMNLLLLRPNTDCIISKYAFYYFSSQSFLRQIPNITKKSVNQASFTVSALKELSFPSVPLNEQLKIVGVLEKIDTLIEMRKQQLTKLDELVKARFVEMFDGKGHPTLKWNDVFNTTTGKLDSNAMVENGEYPFFTCAKEVFRIDKYAFDQEALLLAGNNAAGKYDVKYYKGKFNAYQRTYVLGLKQDWSYQLFRYQLEDKLLYLQEQSLGGLTKYLTLKILGELEFIVPPMNKQNEFAAFVEQVDKSKIAVQKALDEAQTLFDSLMQQYFG